MLHFAFVSPSSDLRVSNKPSRG